MGNGARAFACRHDTLRAGKQRGGKPPLGAATQQRGVHGLAGQGMMGVTSLTTTESDPKP